MLNYYYCYIRELFAILKHLTFVLEALVIFFCSNFIVSCPAGRFVIFEMFDMLIGGLILWRLFSEFRELNCEGEPPVNVTVPVAGGGVSGSGNVTNGSVKSPSSVPFPSLWKIQKWFCKDYEQIFARFVFMRCEERERSFENNRLARG